MIFLGILYVFKLMDWIPMLTIRHDIVTSWVSKSISILQGTTLGCFWKHQSDSRRFLVQEKYTFLIQKVDWKSEISDDFFGSFDFVRWWMIVPCWLLHIIWWLCGYLKSGIAFKMPHFTPFYPKMIHNIIDVCIKWVDVTQNWFKITLKKPPRL